MKTLLFILATTFGMLLTTATTPRVQPTATQSVKNDIIKIDSITAVLNVPEYQVVTFTKAQSFEYYSEGTTHSINAKFKIQTNGRKLLSSRTYGKRNNKYIVEWWSDGMTEIEVVNGIIKTYTIYTSEYEGVSYSR